MTTSRRDSAQAFSGIDYRRLHEMAAELDRPVGTMLALASDNDPFFADREQRRHGAQWFAKLWRRLRLGAGVHLRRIHYFLVSQAKPISGADGEPYVNTTECWKALGKAARDARYLGLVPIKDFVDRRNDEAIERLEVSERPAALSIEEPNLLPTEIAVPQVPNWLPSRPISSSQASRRPALPRRAMGREDDDERHPRRPRRRLRAQHHHRLGRDQHHRLPSASAASAADRPSGAHTLYQ